MPTGPPTPVASQYPAASTGADAATAKPASAARPGQPVLGIRPEAGGPARCGAGPTASIRGVAASSRPAAAIAIAIPGQALTAVPPGGGVSRTRLTTRAMTSPESPMPHPVYTRAGRRRASSAQNAGSTSPAVTQAGGSPGPPGLSSSNDFGRRLAAASPGLSNPASPKNAEGLATRWKLHGMRTAAGTAAAIAALTTVRGPSQRQAATAPSAATTAIGQISGTKAAAIAISRPAAHAARRAARGGPARIRPVMMPTSGSSTKATAVPTRPAATAPIATGSSAYVTAIHSLVSRTDVTRRVARNAVTPAAGTHPSSSTSTASQGLPPNNVARAATAPR